MTNENPNEWSRASRRHQKQPIEPQFARQPAKEPSRYQKLQIALIFATIILLSLVPIYGMLQHRQDRTTVQTTSESSRSVSVATSSSESSVSHSESATIATSSTAVASESSSEQPSTKPAAESSASSTASGTTIKVAQGQTGYKIAHEAGIDPQKLQALNPGVNISALRPGQVLRVK